jgi:hypothetical protein
MFEFLFQLFSSMLKYIIMLFFIIIFVYALFSYAGKEAGKKFVPIIQNLGEQTGEQSREQIKTLEAAKKKTLEKQETNRKELEPQKQGKGTMCVNGICEQNPWKGTIIIEESKKQN